MSPKTYTTYTLQCSELQSTDHWIVDQNGRRRRKFRDSADYADFPEQVAFQIESLLAGIGIYDKEDVMITSTYPNGTKHTETISAEVARQLWKQWVDKGYNRVVPIGGGLAMLSNPYHKVLNNA